MLHNSTLSKLSALLITLFFIINYLPAQKIITVAGNSNGIGPGYAGKYYRTHPCYGVAADKYGNIFFSEFDKATITKVDIDGIISIVAGTLQKPGFSGDGDIATDAKLDGPKGLYVDKDGNIFIADTYNNRIRKVDQAGIITTIAGGGNGGDGGLAVNASLSDPVDVITDSAGNIYISEQAGNKIRKVNRNGIITTVAGNGIGGYNGDSGKAINASLKLPTGICFDKTGNLIIADTYNNRIRKVDKKGIITTIAGNGISGSSCYTDDTTLALKAKIGGPTDVDIDSIGNIITIINGGCVVYINNSGLIHYLTSTSYDPTTLAYNKQNNSVYFNITTEDGCWGLNPNILKFNLDSLNTSAILLSAGYYAQDNGDSIAATLAHLSDPRGIIFSDNYLYVVDAGFFRIKRIDSKGIITTIAGDGTYAQNGYGDGGLAINARFYDPVAIAIDKKKNIYIADNYDNRIRVINSKGIIHTRYKIDSPEGLAIDKHGNLYVSSSSSQSKVYKIDSAGVITTIAGTNNYGYNGDNIPATTAELNFPVGIYVDDNDNLFIADQRNNRIRKVDTAGIITTIAGTGTESYSGDGGKAKDAELDYPTGIIKDKNGILYISDYYNERIRKVDKQNIITTIAGAGIGDYSNCDGLWYHFGTYSGDGDSALNEYLYRPYATAIDDHGNLYISDQFNNRIRLVLNNCTPKPTVFSIAMQQYIYNTFTMQYGCNLLLKIKPRLNYLSALNTNVISNVWVENKVLRDSAGKPFALRHYQVLPESNDDISSTATFTLYFNQSDFNKYNSSTGGMYSKLPTSPNDSNGISNLLIYTYKSKSLDGSGLPTSYKTKLEKINPKNASIIWNATGNYWQVTFDVSSLGGFFVGTEKNTIAAASKEEITQDEIINVYPNPATDNIYVSLPLKLLHKPVQLINSNGKMISEQMANAQTINFNIKNVASGIYLIRFADGEIKKVIVSKN